MEEKTMQQKYLAYCQEWETTPIFVFTSDKEGKVEYGNRNPSELTAMSLLNSLSMGFKRANNLLGEVDYTFKADGFCYFKWK